MPILPVLPPLPLALSAPSVLYTTPKSGSDTLSKAQSGASTSPKLTFINNLKDVQLYTKTKNSLVNTWDQEFGIQATLMRYGNGAEVTNFCYDPLYPIKFDKKPRWSVGFQFLYYFTKLPTKLAFYTKPKNNLIGLWKDETGLTGRLFTSPALFISANIAYVYNLPYNLSQKPQWLAVVNFQFPLGR